MSPNCFGISFTWKLTLLVGETFKNPKKISLLKKSNQSPTILTGVTFDWTWTLDIGHWVLDQSLYIYIYITVLIIKKILTIKYLGIFEGQISIHSVNIFDWTWTLNIRHWTMDIG